MQRDGTVAGAGMPAHLADIGQAYEYDELVGLASFTGGVQSLFDPDDPRFFPPGDMPARIAAACRENGQTPPETPGGFVRSALLSLACKYRLVLERLERITGTNVEIVHMIGGGADNELLCRLTANTLDRVVLAGPVEATALGNVLVQARATGELGSMADLRAVAVASVKPRIYEPDGDRAAAEHDYGRFLEITKFSLTAQERVSPDAGC